MPPLVDTRMPGVYTLEIPTLPPSIAVVQSAVPCFIGYTDIAEKNGEDVTLKAVRVKNIREYVDWFGTSPNQEIDVDLGLIVDESDPNKPKITQVNVKALPKKDLKFRMHYAIQLYYSNGGGPCFIISVGNQKGTDIDEAKLIEGIEAAKKTKDVTILVYPDASKNLTPERYGKLAKESTTHCYKMLNRVTLLDVNDIDKENDLITNNFRIRVPQEIDFKKYAAAYYPFLNTTLSYNYDLKSVTINNFTKNEIPLSETDSKKATDAVEAYITAVNEFNTQNKKFNFYKSISNVLGKIGDKEIELKLNKINLYLKSIDPKDKDSNFNEINSEKENIAKQLELLKKDKKNTQEIFDELKDELKSLSDKIDNLTSVEKENALKSLNIEKNNFLTIATNIAKDGDLTGMTLEILEEVNNQVASKIREAIRDLPVPMPPSPAIAGIMVQTDATQGVWKAPANVGLAAVISPTVEIDDDFHALLNVDASSGKSINAIRAYEGKGILVFGARTLAGNDLEWRYISVRRTFCFIEDSIARAMQDFIFAPNTRDTWIKVKGMISNFLNNIWQAGGLFGNTFNEAYQVNIGLPETMTDVDILEGRMIVEIKLRVSRPAEFIILRYEHKFNANAN